MPPLKAAFSSTTTRAPDSVAAAAAAVPAPPVPRMQMSHSRVMTLSLSVGGGGSRRHSAALPPACSTQSAAAFRMAREEKVAPEMTSTFSV